MAEQSKTPVMNEETARAFFQADAFVKLAGIEIEKITADSAVITAKIGPQHLNANGFVQGGMLYTIADFAFAVHANFLHPTTVTQGGHINYVRAAKTTALTAVAKETLRSGFPFCTLNLRKNRDKRRAKCALSKKPTEEIRNTERYYKSTL